MKLWLLLLLFSCPCIAVAQTFHYPVPPDSISDRQGRVDYMVSHFWNERSIRDTVNFQTPKLLLDYLYLLKQKNVAELDNDIKSFVSLACKQEKTFGRILYWLDNILYDSSSPHYNEGLYLRLTTAVMASETDSVMKLMPKERMRMMCQNRVGGPANDFSYVDKKEKRHKLYDVDAPLLLLVFNNPDCSLCHHAEETMNRDELLQEMITKGELSVLAITPEADFEEWQRHTYPANWSVGFDKDSVIYRKRIYDIQRLPCIYLLDKDKRVLLKEADSNRLIAYLTKHYAVFDR